MSSDPMMWAWIFLALGSVLLVAEIFIPSGGLIGVLAMAFLMLSLWNAFQTSKTVGIWFLMGLMVLIPTVVAVGLSIWPQTPIGRKVVLAPPAPDETESALGHQQRFERLVGQVGTTLTPLRPSGAIDFDGRRIDGASEEGLIPSGSRVRAIRVRNGQVIVRVLSEQELTTGSLLEDENLFEGDDPTPLAPVAAATATSARPGLGLEEAG